MYCTVITQSRSVGIGEGLTYACGDDLAVGALVRVPLRSSLVDGLVIEVMEELPVHVKDVKSVAEVVLSEPLLPAQCLQAAQWIAKETFASFRYALGLFLPTTDWTKLLPAEVTGYSLHEGQHSVRGEKREHVLEYLRHRDWASETEILDHTSVSASILRAMEKAKILKRSKRRADFPGQMPHPEVVPAPKLTEEQDKAYRIIRRSKKPTLLFGVTGSGKTEIYMTLVEKEVKAGGQAIVLVPEILLTESTVGRFLEILPRERIALIHSKLTPAQRRREWLRARTGEASLVLGSRSALFTPCRNLTLIAIDEEHEWTYKNERMPRYHARTVAEELARLWDAGLVLGSATPSLESWHAAEQGRFTLARLPHRYGSAPLPTVRIIDLADAEFNNAYPFTQPLIEAMQARLTRGEQSVLFLNRRGTASALLCLDCRRRVVSPETQLPFTVHTGPGNIPFLLDHATGLRAAVPTECPHCKSLRLHAVGAGTQKLEVLIRRLFPTARVLRVDSDTLESPAQMRELLATMEQNKADILVGTQTVALGLDLPNVTLAGVLVADVGLSLPHFRASERVFQLLSQLSGRSGRRKPGEVIIQTFRPDALEVTAAAKHDAELFLKNESRIRSAIGYPPFGKIIRLLARGPNADKRARQLHAQLSARNMQREHPVKVTVAPTFAGGGKEWHVLIRGENPADILKGITLEDIAVDADPIETL